MTRLLLAGPHVYRIPEWGNATVIEITWAALGAIGVIWAIGAATLIARDRRVFFTDTARTFTPSRLQAARIVWRGALRRELGRCLQNSLVLGVGIWAMTQPPVTRPTVTTPTGLIITAIFLTWISITIGQSIFDARTRWAVVTVLDDKEEE